jgi:hypothetical protein
MQLPVVSHLRFVGNSTLRYCNLTTNAAPSWIRPGVGLNGRGVFMCREDLQLWHSVRVGHFRSILPRDPTLSRFLDSIRHQSGRCFLVALCALGSLRGLLMGCGRTHTRPTIAPPRRSGLHVPPDSPRQSPADSGNASNSSPST